VDEFAVEIAVDFAAQTLDKHVDHVRLRVEIVIPHVLEDHCFRDHAPGVAQQIFEQRELARLQLNLLSVASHFAAQQIECEIGVAQGGWFHCLAGAPDERLNAREQLRKRKRFREVIIAAHLQTFDAIVN